MEAPDCAPSCEEYLAQAYEQSESCGDARTALVQCRGAASSCIEFEQTECSEERQAVAASCGGGDDSDTSDGCGEVGGGGGDDCSYVLDCPGSQRGIDCSAGTCSCLLDGEEVQTCMIDDACGLSMIQLAQQCCGWDDF